MSTLSSVVATAGVCVATLLVGAQQAPAQVKIGSVLSVTGPTRNYRQLAIGVPLYQSHGVASKQFIDLAGPAAEGVRLPAAALLVADKLPHSDPQKPEP